MEPFSLRRNKFLDKVLTRECVFTSIWCKLFDCQFVLHAHNHRIPKEEKSASRNLHRQTGKVSEVFSVSRFVGSKKCWLSNFSCVLSSNGNSSTSKISRWLFPFICLPFHIESHFNSGWCACVCVCNVVHIYSLKILFLLRAVFRVECLPLSFACHNMLRLRWNDMEKVHTHSIRGQSSSSENFSVYIFRWIRVPLAKERE